MSRVVPSIGLIHVVSVANNAGAPVGLRGDGMAKSITPSGGSAASAARPGPRMGPGGGGAWPASSVGSDSDVLPSSAPPPSVAGGPSASVFSRPARWCGPGRGGAEPSLGMGWSWAVETGGRPAIPKSVRSESGSQSQMGIAQKNHPDGVRYRVQVHHPWQAVEGSHGGVVQRRCCRMIKGCWLSNRPRSRNSGNHTGIRGKGCWGQAWLYPFLAGWEGPSTIGG